MKRCPECRRDYYDDSLQYCLDDGAALLEGPATADLPTITMSQRPPETAGATPRSLYGTDYPTQVLPFAQPASFGSVNSIAVLPFANISKDTDVEYFSDGLAEELLNVLSKIRGLRVAARTSAFSFKNKPATIPEIGQKLNVASVVEGSIRMVGERIRIAVQLVNVADGFHIWSDTYDRTLDDIFAVQDDIAQSVVEELRIRLLGEERREEVSLKVIEEVADAVKGRAADPEAQRLMLLGRYFLDRTNPNDALKAVRYFKDALELDSSFALCWAELGRAYSVQAGKSWVSVDEGFRLSREATEKALVLEPELAEAHAQMGRIMATYDWEFESALGSYNRALELAPGNSVVADGASILEFKLGRFDRALELSRKVLAQDPLSGAVWHNLGLICHAAGLLAESEIAYERAIELGPERLVTRAMLSLVLMDQEKVDEAFEIAGHEPDDFWKLWSFSILCHVAGRTAEADAALRKLNDEFADGDAYQIAEVYGSRGDAGNAFTWLERAISERDPGVTHARVSPRFREFYADERWPLLLQKIGFDT